MKKHLSTIILAMIFLIGLSVLLYPMVSDFWNSLHQSKTIASYKDSVDHLDTETYDKILEEAREYNSQLAGNIKRFDMKSFDWAYYNSILDVAGDGVMGFVEIPKIKVSIPIYHSTKVTVLQVGIGHVEGTSLPIGGLGTHACLSGHRGLPSAKLFTDLDRLEVGDVFYITVLKEVLVYEVDQIRIVEPGDISDLMISKDKDYVTLITCTPYAINTHRLLVRGVRTELNETIVVTADALQVDPVIVATAIIIPGLVAMLIFVVIYVVKNKKTLKRKSK